MTPPISGMQAIAAATFDGNPVVDVALELDSGIGGGSWLGLVLSGTLYVHELESALSSNLAPAEAWLRLWRVRRLPIMGETGDQVAGLNLP